MSIVADQRKKNTNPRPNVTPQNNSTNTNTTSQPSQPQQAKKPKQNQTQGQNQSQTQSQTQSQASTKPNSPAPPLKTATPPPPSKAEIHVPLDGFNAAEVDELLSGGRDHNALVYKPEQPVVHKTSPWGQKAGTMATGKDFWLELRKQVALLQKGESTNKGG